MKLLIKIGLVIDLVILIASFILGNFVSTSHQPQVQGRKLPRPCA